MKRLFWLVGIFLLVACGGEPDVAPTPIPDSPATVQPDNGYPVVTSTPIGAYPALPRATPTLQSAYIGLDAMWMTKPVGLQCRAYEIALDVEKASLENAGIQVLDTSMIAIPTCEACDTCPSPEHYRFFIPATDIASAEAMGWMVAE